MMNRTDHRTARVTPWALLTLISAALSGLSAVESAAEERVIVVVSPDGQVFAWHPNGASVAGWETPKTVQTPVEAPPVIGDLTDDEEAEIIVATAERCDSLGAGAGSHVHIWRANGQPLAPWPRMLPGCVRASPVLGNLDDDPALELVVATSTGLVYAFNANGTQLPWSPVDAHGPIVASPSLADLNGNGQIDLAVGTLTGSLYVWDAEAGVLLGQTVTRSRFPLHVQDYQPQALGVHAIRSSPAIGDLDNDLKIELVVGADDGGIYRWDFPGLATGNDPWPTFRQNAARTGSFLGAEGGPTIFSETSPSSHAPVLSAVANQTTGDHEPLAFTLVASDPDGDALTWGLGVTNAKRNQEGGDVIAILVDVNGDGFINWTDTVRIDQLTLTNPIDTPEELLADLDRNGVVTVTDRDLARAAFADLSQPIPFLNTLTRTVTINDPTPSGAYQFTFIVSDGALIDSKTAILAVGPLNPVEVWGVVTVQPSSGTTVPLSQATVEVRKAADYSFLCTATTDSQGIYRNCNVPPLFRPSASSNAYLVKVSHPSYGTAASSIPEISPYYQQFRHDVLVSGVEVYGTVTFQDLLGGGSGIAPSATVSIYTVDTGTLLCQATADASGNYTGCRVPPLSPPPGYSYAYSVMGSHPTYGRSWYSITSIASGSPPVRRDVLIWTYNCPTGVAAYGTALTQELDVLRTYRDTVLSRSWLGRTFTRTYYEIGPSVARFIHDKPLARALVRGLLKPLITYCRGQLPSAHAERE